VPLSRGSGHQETAFADAPILNEEHYTHVKTERTFDFYFRAAAAHWSSCAKTGSYWWTNTLDNYLSNETMIAIAKGCAVRRPIHK